MYENKARKFNIKIQKMSRFSENKMKTKRKDCDHAIFPFIGINFVKRGQLHLLRWLMATVHQRKKEERD